jgi:hypothetical protein
VGVGVGLGLAEVPGDDEGWGVGHVMSCVLAPLLDLRTWGNAQLTWSAVPGAMLTTVGVGRTALMTTAAPMTSAAAAPMAPAAFFWSEVGMSTSRGYVPRKSAAIISSACQSSISGSSLALLMA